MKIEQKEFKGIRYLVYYPKNYVEGQKYPLFFHLHGAGSRGNDFSAFDHSVVLSVINKGDSPLSNCICVFPQCHTDTWFDIFSELLELVKELYNRPDVDQNIFLGSGISMGGYGIYQVMMSLNTIFHKGIVCCGGGMHWNAGRLWNIPLRIFHGKNDPIVNVNEAIWMQEKINESGGNASLTIYPDCEHNCWDKTYLNYDNLEWLVS